MEIFVDDVQKSQEKESVSSIHVISFKLLNQHLRFLYPKLYKLKKNIMQSMMPVPFEVYVCSMIFFSLYNLGYKNLRC